WIVVDQHAPVAVQHATTRRNDRDRTHAIAFRHHAIFIGIDDLEFPEAQQQKRDHAHDHVGSGGQPFLRQSAIVAKPVRHASPAREPVYCPGLSGARSRYPLRSVEVRTLRSAGPFQISCPGPRVEAPEIAARLSNPSHSKVFFKVAPVPTPRNSSESTGFGLIKGLAKVGARTGPDSETERSERSAFAICQRTIAWKRARFAASQSLRFSYKLKLSSRNVAVHFPCVGEVL